MQAANWGLRFLLELCALAVYGYWGYTMGDGNPFKWIFGIGMPLIAAIAWGMFGSPKAPVQLSPISHLLFEIIVFGLPAVLLFALGKPVPAVAYGVLVILNRVLIHIGDRGKSPA